MNRPIRVLIAKVGLDGHDRGAKVIASFLRDAGMEVIYTGLRQTPEMVVNAAMQEDVDVIGISILSGAHNTVFPKIVTLMNEKGLNDVLLTGGGIIPEKDMEKLQQLVGVCQNFGHDVKIEGEGDDLKKSINQLLKDRQEESVRDFVKDWPKSIFDFNEEQLDWIFEFETKNIHKIKISQINLNFY